MWCKCNRLHFVQVKAGKSLKSGLKCLVMFDVVFETTNTESEIRSMKCKDKRPGIA